MLTDLWPLAFMLGLFAFLYLMSLALKALGIHPGTPRRPGIPSVPEQSHTRQRTTTRGRPSRPKTYQEIPAARLLAVYHNRLVESEASAGRISPGLPPEASTPRGGSRMFLESDS